MTEGLKGNVSPSFAAGDEGPVNTEEAELHHGVHSMKRAQALSEWGHNKSLYKRLSIVEPVGSSKHWVRLAQSHHFLYLLLSLR